MGGADCGAEMNENKSNNVLSEILYEFSTLGNTMRALGTSDLKDLDKGCVSLR